MEYSCGHSTDDNNPPEQCPLCFKSVRRSKYNSVGVRTEDGYFRSNGEYKRWCELKLMERNGLIRCLMSQVNYWLESIKQRVTWDFYYKEVQEDGSEKEVVEDFKGLITGEYRKNCKWFRVEYPNVILRESRAKNKRSKRIYLPSKAKKSASH